MTVTAPEPELKARIMDFVGRASTEITPSHVARLPELAAVLRAGTAVYVDHPSKATLGQVVRASLAVQRSGFRATPHIAARRIANAQTLRLALAELRAGGVEQILLVAGDVEHPAGEFTSTLDIFESGILERSGIMRVGVAGHPEGNKSVGLMLLWDALRIKQQFAERTGISLYIVSQFGLNAAAMAAWQRDVTQHGVRLPIHVGIAGPAPLSALIRNLSAIGSVADLATTPDQHLLALLSAPPAAQIVAPHFFAFGGSVETARWMRKIAGGEFEVDRGAVRLRITA